MSSSDQEKSLFLLEKLFKRLPTKRWLLLPKDEIEGKARNSLCRALELDLITVQRILLTAGIFQKKKTEAQDGGGSFTTTIQFCEAYVIDWLNHRFRKQKIIFQTAKVALHHDDSGESRLLLFVIRTKPRRGEQNPTVSYDDVPPVIAAAAVKKKTRYGEATTTTTPDKKIRDITSKSIARWDATYHQRSPTPTPPPAVRRSHHHQTTRKETPAAKTTITGTHLPGAARRRQRRISFSRMVSVIRDHDEESVDLRAEATKIETVLNNADNNGGGGGSSSLFW